ncbi:MAG: hypothetical protein ACR2GP_13305 [Burkholderiaceae bacterium]
MPTPEALARMEIDRLLQAGGWHVCGMRDANLYAALGVAIREFPLNAGFGFADYLLYIDGKACGVIEAKKQGATAHWRRETIRALRTGPASEPSRVAETTPLPL